MRQALVVGLLAPVVLVVATGCATKGWVRDLVGQKEAEIDRRITVVDGRVGSEAQRVDQVEVRVSAEAQRVEGMGFRVTEVEKATGEVRETAQAARTRADSAFTRSEEVDGRLTRLWSQRHARTLADTVNVQFGFDRADLGDGAQTALLGIARELKQNPNLTIELEGFTDTRGPRDYNIQLSQRRVEAVRRFLVEQGVELPRIHAVGLGPSPEKEAAPAAKRRVTVRVMLAAE